MCGSVSATSLIIRGTCPPSSSVTACGPLLYGTCTISTPASNLNNSPAIWSELPLPPPEPNVNIPGFALASAIRSLIELTGDDGLTLTALLRDESWVTGSKSRNASYGSLR